MTDAAPAHHLPIRVRVNGADRELEVDTRGSLLDVLRERLDLTGTKKGCDHGQCGVHRARRLAVRLLHARTDLLGGGHAR